MDEKENFILINNADEFLKIKDDLSASYKLAADIDFEGKSIVSIGTASAPFTGEVDGDGHCVKNFKISSSTSYIGLFGYAREAMLKNLRVENAEVTQTSSGGYTGSLAGYLSYCEVENISLIGITVCGKHMTGGLAGYVYEGSIKRCGGSGSVKGSSDVGGLVGYMRATMENCFFTGSVESETDNAYTGGLIGENAYAKIRNCYVASTVSSEGKGLSYTPSSSTVENSYYDSLAAGFGTTDTNNVGKLTTALISKNFYKNWDFEDVWDIEDGRTYPYLRGWKRPEGEVNPGTVSGGAGTEEDPYQIESAQELECIRYDLSGCYRLVADIDFSGVEITPIGTYGKPFKGSFDGDGHCIKNFKRNSNSAYTGLFGYATTAIFKNLQMENVEVTQTSSGNYTGSLAGYLLDCEVENISLVGINVYGKQYTGGLAGYVYEGSIKRCGGLGSVKGSSDVGGLVGDMRATIENCFFIGSVESETDSKYTGGLIGENAYAEIRNCYAASTVSSGGMGLSYTFNNSSVENSYYDSMVAGFGTTDTNNVGKLTAALISKSFYKDWDFEDVWDIEDGKTYPYLRGWKRPEGEVNPGAVSDGAGTEEDPYQIESMQGVECIQYDLSGCYKLVADIDFSGESPTLLGTSSKPFKGCFNGNGHCIKNFKINNSSAYTGLFGYARTAILKNLQMENVEVTQTSSGNYTGSLAGYLLDCEVENINLVGINVCGKQYTGGMAGYVYEGSIKRCGGSGSVKGSSDVGGLVGDMRATMENCFFTGSVESETNNAYTGGLIGENAYAVIRNSYAASAVSSGGKGLSYTPSSTTVENSYYDSLAAGFGTTDTNNVGKLTAALVSKSFYKDWDFEDVWDIEDGRTYPYLRGWKRPEGEVNPGTVSGGAGTEEDPYQIESAQGLECIRYDLSGCYRLVADIDFSGVEITPIGTYGKPFKGSFDGDGHCIKNFKRNSNSAYTGLFGYATTAIFKNLQMENVEVTQTSSGNFTGSLAGYLLDCEVENINLVGIIVCGEHYTGGLAGYVYEGSIKKCGMTGSVKGNSNIGGLVGYMRATMENCFFIGSVESETNSKYTGGLVGANANAKIRNCYAASTVSPSGKGLSYTPASITVENSYYDSLVAGFGTTDVYNVGKLTSALLQRGFYKDWDFENVWNIEDGKTYPYLRGWKRPEGDVNSGAVLGGIGTEEDPYQLGSSQGLGCIQYDMSGCYKLVADIDFKGETPTLIGAQYRPFKGSLDGDGYCIRNFVINSNEQYTGLFRCATAAVFKNLHLDGAEIHQTSTGYYTGTLAGYLENCTVENINLTNTVVSGQRHTGGLAGRINGGSIVGCSVNAGTSVSGTLEVGGLIGYAYDNSAEVRECCVLGEVTGGRYLGGLIGYTNAKVSNSFVRGKVVSQDAYREKAGLVGYAKSTVVENCYAACGNNGCTGGLVGTISFAAVNNSYFDTTLSGVTTPEDEARTTEQMKDKATYSGWDWENVWDIQEDSYPVLRKMEILNEEPYELTVRDITCCSLMLEWQETSKATEYEVTYAGKREVSSEPKMQLVELAPDTEYEFRVRAKIGSENAVWSKVLKVRTQKVAVIEGVHYVAKEADAVTLAWNPVKGAVNYEIICGDSIYKTDGNTYRLTGLCSDTPYTVVVRALMEDGSVMTSNTVMEKVYTVNPQTEYAKNFMEKCENQLWFMDEIEKLLNTKGKSINTINSQRDFATIYMIDLTNRGVSGQIPAAIGELSHLKYLYLANNDLDGDLPDELNLLGELIEKDLSGNRFTE